MHTSYRFFGRFVVSSFRRFVKQSYAYDGSRRARFGSGASPSSSSPSSGAVSAGNAAAKAALASASYASRSAASAANAYP
jgi:hypothetical protein